MKLWVLDKIICLVEYLSINIIEFKLPQQRKHMSNCSKKNNFIEANVMNIFAKFQL